MFMALGWFIIWAPPYCPKFQPIELVWGVAKQHAARLWYKGRTLAMALKHLRFGFYGGVPRVGMGRWATTNVAGCVRAAYDEMDKWIKGDLERNADGLIGTIDHLGGWERRRPCRASSWTTWTWTGTPRPLLTSSRLMGCTRTATTRAGRSSGGEVRPFLWVLGGGC